MHKKLRGPEFISKTFMNWCKKNFVEIKYTQPGKPMQNGYIERFNRFFREDVLDAYYFNDPFITCHEAYRTEIAKANYKAATALPMSRIAQMYLDVFAGRSTNNNEVILKVA
jgi:transposase InsO family protein